MRSTPAVLYLVSYLRFALFFRDDVGTVDVCPGVLWDFNFSRRRIWKVSALFQAVIYFFIAYLIHRVECYDFDLSYILALKRIGECRNDCIRILVLH